MKKIFIGLIALGSITASAQVPPRCFVNNYTGQYFELEINKPVETGAPFGLVELIDIERVDHFYISSKENSSVTIYSVLNDRLNIQKENSDADIRAYLYCSVK